MPGKDSTALARARSHLARQTARARATPDGRLPTIARMARLASVAPRTMHKAVLIAVQGGILRTAQRAGIHVVADTVPCVSVRTARDGQQAAAPARRWKQLAHELELQIAQGGYAPGERLPPAKTLAEKHGVCHATLARALRHLASTGQLLRSKRGYRARSLRVTAADTSVLLVAVGDENGNLAVHTPRVEEHLRTLERECASANVRLTLYTYTFWNDALYGPGSRLVGRQGQIMDSRPLGLLLWTQGIPVASLARLASLTGTGDTPVGVLNELDQDLIPESLLNRPRTFVASIASDVSAGAQVGRFLRDLGHRTVAYVSPVHALEWSAARLRGLARAFDEAGLPGGVRAFTADGTFHPHQPEPATVEEAVRAVVGGKGPADADHSLLLRALRASWPQVEQSMRDLVIGQVLERLMQQALGFRDVTAWVAANDGVALDAVGFLHRSGLRVPQHLSVVGFDDTLEAFRHGLTSFNFNAPALMHAMLGWLLAGRRRGLGNRGRRSAEIDGFVTSRQSVAVLQDRPGRQG